LLRLWLLLTIILCAREDFISHYDYGQMLYDNPRGISCVKCHGKKGEGIEIASYICKDKNSTRVSLRGSDIRNVELKGMIKSLKSRHKIMPNYYLTIKEVKAIYDYLKKINKRVDSF